MALCLAVAGCSDEPDGGGGADDFSAAQVRAVHGALSAAPDALADVAESLLTETLAAAAGMQLATSSHSLTCQSGTGSMDLDYEVSTAACATGTITTLSGTVSTAFSRCERSACDQTAVQDGANSGDFVLEYNGCTGVGTFVGTDITTGTGCSDTSTMTARIGDGDPFPIGYRLDITIGIPGFEVEGVSGTVCTETGPCSESGGCAFDSFDNLFAVIDPSDACHLGSSSANTCRAYYLDPATQTDPDPQVDAANKDFCLNVDNKQEGNCCVGSSQCGAVVDGNGNPVAGACCPYGADDADCAGHESCECFPAP